LLAVQQAGPAARHPGATIHVIIDNLSANRSTWGTRNKAELRSEPDSWANRSRRASGRRACSFVRSARHQRWGGPEGHMTLPASLSGQGSSLLYAIDIVITLILTRSAIDLVPRAACARRPAHAVVAQPRDAARLATVIDLRPIPRPAIPHPMTSQELPQSLTLLSTRRTLAQWGPLRG
jgi:hypothetical protein